MYKYSDQISIYHSGKQLTFNPGLYHADIIGGWGIERNGFIMELVNEETLESVLPVHPFPIQSIYGKRRGKRVFDFEINEGGIYAINFHSMDNLVVRTFGMSSRFSIFRLLDKRIENSTVSIIFYRKKESS